MGQLLNRVRSESELNSKMIGRKIDMCSLLEFVSSANHKDNYNVGFKLTAKITKFRLYNRKDSFLAQKKKEISTVNRKGCITAIFLRELLSSNVGCLFSRDKDVYTNLL